MATCPHCFQEKPMLADKCPHCTADVEIGEQVRFSAVTTVIGVFIMIMIFAALFG